MPKIEDLDCEGCDQLIDLPDMPVLRILNCARCHLIATLPDMHDIQSINYFGCPLLHLDGSDLDSPRDEDFY